MLTVLLKISVLCLSMKRAAFGSSVSHNEVVVVQNHSQGNSVILPKPSAYIINHTRLVVCRSRLQSLKVSCKGLRHKVPLQRLTTVDDHDIQPVTTSRLIVTSHVIKSYKRSIICYCVDTSTNEKSDRLEIPTDHARYSNITNFFKPKKDRKRTVNLLRPVKISWRHQNSTAVNCLHDGQLLSREKVFHARGKSIIIIKKTLSADAGFYYCRTNSGVFSSWLKLQVKGGWSKWYTWLPCSTHCGAGRKVETRSCLEARQHNCHGPRIRTVPCVAPCKGIVPEFVEVPQDLISNASSTYVSCGAQFGSDVFTVQLFCSSNGWKINNVFNNTVTRRAANKTVTIVTYKVELHRDRDGIALVFCHCEASTNEMSKRSKIANITFISSVEVDAADHVPTAKASSRLSNRFIILTTTTVGSSIIILFLLVILAMRYKRLTESRSSCAETMVVSTRETSITSAESGQVRYSEPCDIRATKLHASFSVDDKSISQNRASDTPLLKCVDERSDAAEDCVSHPLGYTAGDAPCDDSVFKRGGSCKSNVSKISAFSSVSAAFCSTPEIPDTVDPDLCAWGQFTEKGGRLTIKGTGVSLYIPSMALPNTSSQIIYIGLMNSKGSYPKLNGKEALLSPVVVCGPDGLTFDKPVYLTVPHNAVIDENRRWSPQVQSCSTVDDDDEESKWKVLEKPEGDPPLSHVDKKYMQIMIDHFTNFVIVGAPDEMEAWIVAFFTEPKVDRDCTVRVYCIPATDAAYKVLEGIESKVNGKTSDTPKLLRIKNNNKCLQIKGKLTNEGWCCVTDQEKNISFLDIWHSIDKSPNVSYVFERVSTSVFKFRSFFDVNQEHSGNGVEVHVTFTIQTDRRVSSGYSSQENGFEPNVKYKIPIEVRRQLCHLLDPEDLLEFNDWRRFAEKLGCCKSYTNWLKSNSKVVSPTDHLIDWWEMTKSDEISLQHLAEMFNEMERYDVVSKLEEIPGWNNVDGQE